MKNKNIIQLNAKPFLKWAGGKSQLLKELESRLPEDIKTSHRIKRYIEPFIGGGAMFFYLKNNYTIEKSFIFDVNRDLILAYKVIQKHHAKLIKMLSEIEHSYLNKNETNRKDYYFETRDKYNKQMHNFDYDNFSFAWIIRTAYMIFFNKTCFNGLFRQNKSGEFNVPHSRYKNPTICDVNNIAAVSYALNETEIICGDFEESSKYITKSSVVYLDPPYRPLTETASFTAYNKDGFNEADQKRLAKYYKEKSNKGAFLILSNSDPKNENKKDDFFDNLYTNYKIDRVLARRMINCDSSKRGEIRELIITNI